MPRHTLSADTQYGCYCAATVPSRKQFHDLKLSRRETGDQFIQLQRSNGERVQTYPLLVSHSCILFSLTFCVTLSHSLTGICIFSLNTSTGAEGVASHLARKAV